MMVAMAHPVEGWVACPEYEGEHIFEESIQPAGLEHGAVAELVGLGLEGIERTVDIQCQCHENPLLVEKEVVCE